MNIENPIAQTARALAFLTRLPIPNRYFDGVGHDQASACAGFYPIAGIIIALIGSVILAFGTLLQIDSAVIAAITVLAMTALTGALHEDGLGDVCDGFGGGMDKAQRLEIMKDSRLGTYGVIGVGGALLISTLALNALISNHGLWGGILALIAVSAASRGAMVWMWAALPNARGEGVSSSFGQPPEDAVSLAAIFALISIAIFGTLSSGFVPSSIALGFGILTLISFQKLCTIMIGGQTGDTLGGCQKLVELSLLVGLASAL